MKLLLVSTLMFVLVSLVKSDGSNSSPDVALSIPADCPDTYRLNPHSLTCFKLVKQQMHWATAKTYCENSERGYLATPSTTQSAIWLQMQQRIGDWNGDGNVHIWLGGHKSDTGVWEWRGLNTGPIFIDFWAQGEPSGDGECLVLYDNDNTWTGRWNDAHCAYRSGNYFFCERLPY